MNHCVAFIAAASVALLLVETSAGGASLPLASSKLNVVLAFEGSPEGGGVVSLRIEAYGDTWFELNSNNASSDVDDWLGIQHHGKWLTPLNGGLRLINVSRNASTLPTDGMELLFETTTMLPRVRWVVGTRRIDNLGFALYQAFPDGLHPEDENPRVDEVVSAFPSLGSPRKDLGCVWFDGVQLQRTRWITWRANEVVPPAAKSVDKSKGGGDGAGSPLVLLDAQGAALVVGPSDHFFTSANPPSDRVGGRIAFGFQTSVVDIPAGLEHITILRASRTVEGALSTFGDALLVRGRKVRPVIGDEKHVDPGLTHISYYTDNGAYYYYHTMKTPPGVELPKVINVNASDTGYTDTAERLGEWFARDNLPFGSIQFDSWWYHKDIEEGCTLWEPLDPVFFNWTRPASLGDMPLILHSRWFAANSTYVQSGKYDFIIDHDSAGDAKHVAVPVDPKFFYDIMDKAKDRWLMATYEQDFLTATYENTKALQRTPGLARRWLKAMNEGAERAGVTIQYCMALPRHILQSAVMTRVTHIRASHDYGQSRADDTEQWSLMGFTNALIWSLGALPFKDTFWTSARNAGNVWGDDATELDSELQAVVSVLSAGPVSPSDKIGGLNVSILMKTCRSDGWILKPDRPAFLCNHALKLAVVDGRSPAHVWDAPASHDWRIVFAANLTRGSFAYPIPKDGTPYVAKNIITGAVRDMRGMSSLILGPHQRRNDTKDCRETAHAHPSSYAQYCTPFELWLLAPVRAYGKWAAALLGETGKYVPVSRGRWTMMPLPDAFVAKVSCAPGESFVAQVALFRGRGEMDVIAVTCACDSIGATKPDAPVLRCTAFGCSCA